MKLAGVDGMTFSMSAAEAARYAETLGARTIVPVHYGGWRHFTKGKEAAEAEFAATAVADPVRWLIPGSARMFTV